VSRRLALAAAALVAAARGGAAGEPAAYRIAPVERGGSIRGICRVDGDVARPTVPAWPAMGNDAPIPSDRVLVGEDRRLGGCVVRLARLAAGKDWPEPMRAPERVAWLTAEGGRFDPHVQWVRAGTQLGVRSRLPGDMAVHGYRDVLAETQFNFMVRPGAEKDDVSDAHLLDPGVYFVTEDGRHALTAYVHVVAHPYVDLTSERARPGREAGEYVLEDVPPGEHEVMAWHEGMGQEGGPPHGPLRYSPETTLRKRATVAPGRPSYVDFEFPAPPPPRIPPAPASTSPKPEEPASR